MLPGGPAPGGTRRPVPDHDEPDPAPGADVEADERDQAREAVADADHDRESGVSGEDRRAPDHVRSVTRVKGSSFSE